MGKSWKGGKFRAIHDQVARRSGANGLEDGPKRLAGLLQPILQQDIHAAAVVRHSGDAAVFQDRLSRYRSIAPRSVRSAPRVEAEKGPALHDAAKDPRTAVKKRAFDRLQHSIFRQAHVGGLIGDKPEGAIDATGFESRHLSRYYVKRRGQKRHARFRYPKLTVLCETASYLWGGVTASEGPSNDHLQFSATVLRAVQCVRLDRLLGDSGYDSEENHRLCREELDIRSTVFALNPRRSGRQWPKTKYRRQMKRRLFRRGYGNRWHAESSFSAHKRVLGSALRARSEDTRNQEILWRGLTHNLMILRRAIQRVSTKQSYHPII